MKWGKVSALVAAAIGAAALTACVPTTTDNNYHGTVSNTGAPAPVSTVSTPPPVPAVPVSINGSGEQVQTVDLVAAGYTITYQASSNCLIVAPVQADGSDGHAAVNECAMGEGSLSGTTTYRSTGRTTFHVSNTEGDWSLTFNPL